MARKKHLINVHTSTGTTAPSGASLYLGEIAVQHTTDEPALWIKVGSAETSTVYEKFIGLTEITNIFNESKILGSGYTYSGLSYVNSATSIADAYSALTKEIIDDEKVTAAALNDLNNRVNELPSMTDLTELSASVVTNVESIEYLSGRVETDELVTAAALNDLNDRVNVLSASSGDFGEVFEAIQENEEVVAGALNDLNDRVGTVETRMTGDYIPLTGYYIASGLTEEELALNEEDTVNEAFGKLQKQMLDNEEAIAAGLNDLNTRVDENTSAIAENARAIAENTGVTMLSGAVMTLSAATNSLFYNAFNSIEGLDNSITALSSVTAVLSSATDSKITTLSGVVSTLSAKTNGVLTLNLNGVEQGKYSPSASTTINLEAIQEVTGADVLLTGYALATGTTEEELAILATDTVNEAFGKLQKQNYDNETVTAGALNDLNDKIAELENDSAITSLSALVLSNELVVAAALNDLNDRMLTGVSVNGVSAQVSSNVAELVMPVPETTLGSGYTYSGLPYVNSATSIADAYSALTKEIIDDEYAISSAFNDLNNKITALSGGTESAISAIVQLPLFTPSDEGKVLMISGGTLTWVMPQW